MAAYVSNIRTCGPIAPTACTIDRARVCVQAGLRLRRVGAGHSTVLRIVCDAVRSRMRPTPSQLALAEAVREGIRTASRASTVQALGRWTAGPAPVHAASPPVGAAAGAAGLPP